MKKISLNKRTRQQRYRWLAFAYKRQLTRHPCPGLFAYRKRQVFMPLYQTHWRRFPKEKKVIRYRNCTSTNNMKRLHKMGVEKRFSYNRFNYQLLSFLWRHPKSPYNRLRLGLTVG